MATYEDFEQWDVDGLSPFAIEVMHSPELAQEYAEWIYKNQK